MNVILPCSKRKCEAPNIIWNRSPIVFEASERKSENIFTPWSTAPDSHLTFVDVVREFNRGSKSCRINSLGNPDEALIPAGMIYAPAVYKEALKWSKTNNHSLYILSAGWGLISANTKIPVYDVTFSRQPGVPSQLRTTPVKRSKETSLNDLHDFNQETHLFLTREYLRYFRLLNLNLSKLVIHALPRKSARTFVVPQAKIVTEDLGGIRTNWHYSAVKRFINCHA